LVKGGNVRQKEETKGYQGTSLGKRGMPRKTQKDTRGGVGKISPQASKKRVLWGGEEEVADGGGRHG